MKTPSTLKHPGIQVESTEELGEVYGAHRPRLGVAEAIATFGLILTILGTGRHRQPWVPASVALYITAAYGSRRRLASPIRRSPWLEA